MHARKRVHDREIVMKQAFDKQGKGAGRRVCRIVPWVLGLLLGLAVMLAGGPLGAAEVYTWTDEDGVQHFSDKPRTDGQSETIQAEEAYRPGTADVYSQPAEAAEAAEPAEAAAADAAAEAPVSAAAARREEQALKRAQRREAKAELDRQCAQHRQRLEQIEPSRRVFHTDASGETVRLDDEERVRLVEESKAFLAENCQD
jgi:Domain of unknown function (DUF4124)